jgi:hypothetical protein
MPNQPADEFIPECVDAQLPTGTCLRFCFDGPLMTSDAGLLLLSELAAQSGHPSRASRR